MEACEEATQGLAFGRFRILPREGRLLAEGEPVELGSRAFDLLLALAEASGTVVRKDVLISRVWQNRTVSDNNLQVQVKVLRKALGPDRDLIRTIPGRGYQFTGNPFPLSVTSGREDRPEAPAIRPGTAPATLPKPLSELIGRESELADILGLARQSRLVTVTGAGGVGKTRIACEAAWQLLPEFPDGVVFVDLSSAADAAVVPRAVADAAGLDLPADKISLERVAAAIAARRLLLVLDTCEHVIDAAAALAERLLRAGTGVRVLATSREPLQAGGEWVYRLRPLPVPDSDARQEVLEAPAVCLFVARARATDADIAADRNVAAIADICRRLDGIPLAIELAAARAATLGIHTLAACLDDRLQLLTCGRRTALPRHQTLRALLDWSYELLTPVERTVLRRLAVFRRAFALDEATAVAAGDDLDTLDATDSLANLVAKSLVAGEHGQGIDRYRLLETTRAYALEKLIESGECPGAAGAD